MLKQVLAACTALTLIATLIAPGASAQTLNIAVVTTLTGPQAPLGEQIRDGFQLALDQHGGKLGGMTVDLTIVDDELKPDVAVTKIRGLMESKRQDFVIGPVFSVVKAAIFKPVTGGGAYLISPNAGLSTFAGKACSPDLFVTSYQNDQPHSISGQFATDKGYKRAFIIAPNYQAGRDALNGFKSRFKGEVVNEDYVPLNQMDMQSEIAKIADAKPDMLVCSQEVFGPVVAITAYETFDEALALANDTRYGLQAAVFTADITKGLKAARTLDFGGVLVNEVPTWRADQMPYGGVRDSGNTREGPAWSVREMTEERLVILNG